VWRIQLHQKNFQYHVRLVSFVKGNGPAISSMSEAKRPTHSQTRIYLVLLGQLACLRTRIVRNWPCRQPLTHIRILGSQIKPKINIKSKTNKGHTKSKFRWKFTDAEGSLNNHLVRQWLSSNFAANSQSKFWQITTPSNEARRWNFSPFSKISRHKLSQIRMGFWRIATPFHK
jgi:hypothetical protein